MRDLTKHPLQTGASPQSCAGSLDAGEIAAEEKEERELAAPPKGKCNARQWGTFPEILEADAHRKSCH